MVLYLVSLWGPFRLPALSAVSCKLQPAVVVPSLWLLRLQVGSFELPHEGVDETSGQAVLESEPEIASNPVW